MLAEADLFSPRHYEGVRRPLLDAETMPAWCYTSPAFYRREVDRILQEGVEFRRLGHVRFQIRGDYFTLTFAGVPLIILRDGEGTIRAFANTCRHRGSELLIGQAAIAGGSCVLTTVGHTSSTVLFAALPKWTRRMTSTNRTTA